MSLYYNPSARVFISVTLSGPFDLSNRTKQGCPLSPIIFTLAIGPFGEAIRADPLIQGLQIGTYEHKIGLLTDDIILSISNPLSSLPRIPQLIAEFGRISYYKINSSKRQTLAIGQHPDQVHHLQKNFPYSWGDKLITYLGIQ